MFNSEQLKIAGTLKLLGFTGSEDWHDYYSYI